MTAQTPDLDDLHSFPFTDAEAPTDAPEGETEAFCPDTADKVDWVLSKMADARAKAARIRENAEKMAREADADADGLLFRYGPALQAFARQELTGKKKSLRLYHGMIGYRTKPAALNVTDERAALEWAQEHMPDVVMQKVDRALLAATLLQTGEVAPGTALVPAQEVFYVK